MSSQTSFDYIVVGAGSAGCVIARRLSEDPKVNVLLLEEGGPDSEWNIHHSYVPNILELWQSCKVTRQYAVAKQRRPGPMWPTLARGIVRGGSSSINGMIYVRGNQRNYDQWAELGNEGWSYKDVLPYFKKSEDFEGDASDHHAVGGALSVRKMVDPTPVALAFTRAAVNLGYEGSDWDFNTDHQEGGAGLYQVNVTKYGTRASTAVAFLDPIEYQRPNLTEKNGALVYRVLLDKGKAIGVECLVNEVQQTFHAEREVIVAAGAFGSPQLLMLSGIGPADELKAHGISPQVDLGGVGQNLQDHLMLFMFYQSKQPLPEPKFIAEAGLFTNTPGRSKEEPPDLQFMFCAGMSQINPPGVTDPNFLFCPALIQPKSRGKVALLSGDPRHSVSIEPNYLKEEADVQVLLAGITLARKLAGANAFDEFNGGELTPGSKKTNAELREFVRATAHTVWHPAGTCKMGTDPLAVVDAQLRVHQVKGLRVADASIMPLITSGNINAPTIMIAEKAADMIKSDNK